MPRKRSLLGRDAKDRRRLLAHPGATVAAVQLLELLPSNPVVTGSLATELLGSSAPTARKAIEVLRKTGVLHETSGRRRDRVSMYEAYLRELAADDASA